MSEIHFGIKCLGFRCPKFILESDVLESGVQKWLCNHKSWNQVSGMGLGIMCLVIIFPESSVQNWFWKNMSWNEVSGFGIGNTCLGIRCLGIRCLNVHWKQVSWNYMSFITCLGIRCPFWIWNQVSFGIRCQSLNRNKCHCNHISGNKHLDTNVLESEVLESNETHPCFWYVGKPKDQNIYLRPSYRH